MPENRRRLQGTLLTCSLYKRSPMSSLADSDAAVVQFTATVGGDPKGVVRSTENLTASAAAIGKTLNIKGTDRVLCTVPLHHSYGFDFGHPGQPGHGATLFLEDEISPKRITKLLREQVIDVFPGNPALFGSLVRVPTIKPLQASPTRATSARARSCRRRSPRASTSASASGLLSCYHSTQAGPLAIDRAGQGSGDRRQAVRRRRAAGRGAERRQDRRRRARADLDPLERAVDAVGARRSTCPSARDGVPIGGADGENWYRTGDLGTHRSRRAG